MTRKEIIDKLIEGGKMLPVMTEFEAAEVFDFIVTNLSEKPIIPDEIPIYFKIPITTKYSEDLSLFDKSVTNVVEGTEFCEKDPNGDSCCCWYVSTIFGTSDDKEWLLHEIAELGYNPTFVDFRKGLFKVMKPNNR